MRVSPTVPIVLLLVFGQFSIVQKTPLNAQEKPQAVASPPDAPADAIALEPELDDLDDLLNADLGQLATTDISAPVFSESVTSVARREDTVGRSPAAVYVITSEVIRRSGVRSIPEALRLAPGVQVAKINASTWAISIRGFNERFSNKLLVLIDGRTVYTPLFAGVFWDVQDTLLEDIDRIEVIRGPGAAVWGANAVNGVINIITKRAGKTQGTFAEAGGGDERGFASARIGSQFGDVSWRLYGKWFDRDGGILVGRDAVDDWQMSRAGFRADWQQSAWDTVTIQGDFYEGQAGFRQLSASPIAPPFIAESVGDSDLTGGNALMRWTHEVDEESEFSLQLYFDRTERLVGDFREDRDTLDLDFQHRFAFRQWHSVTWGLGYRNTRDDIRNSFQLRFSPEERSIDRFSTFVQDRMTLLEDRWYLIAGTKASWNDFTGFEIQPTGRLLFTPSHRTTLWGSVSRAVRVPSRSSDDIFLITPPASPLVPVFPTVIGDRSLDSEELIAWEVGMRSAPTDEFFWDAAAFFNQYDLHTLALGRPGFSSRAGLPILPLTFSEGNTADGYGFELASTWQVNPAWSLRGAYSFLRLDVHPSRLSATGSASEGQSPRNQFFLHSSWDLGTDWELDMIGRYTDNLPTEGIPNYFELDTRLAWRPNEIFEFAVVGRNLLDQAHPEFGSETFTGLVATEVPREVYGMVTLRY